MDVARLIYKGEIYLRWIGLEGVATIIFNGNFYSFL